MPGDGGQQTRSQYDRIYTWYREEKHFRHVRYTSNTNGGTLRFPLISSLKTATKAWGGYHGGGSLQRVPVC